VHTTKSGSRLRVATHWVLQRSETGEAIGVIEVTNDITDRLRAEEALQRLADLVESSNDAIIGTSLDGIIDSWNSSAESLFGYSAGEMIGESIDRLTPVTYRASQGLFASSSRAVTVTAALPQVIGAERHETVRRTKTGKEIDVSITVSPIRNSAGEVIGTSQIVHDISDAKAREEAFRLSEERQRLAVEAGQIGLWYMDVDDSKCIWTQRSKELHGLSAESEVPDFPAVLLLIHPEDRQAVGAAFAKVMSGNAALAMEYRTTGLDFRTKWLQIRGQAQLDSAGRVKGVHGTLIDLTARKEMEDKLRRANTELEQFAYAAAHDLQEPLRNVALAAALLKVDPADPRHLLVTVIENAHRMEAMVKDLLAYSRALDTPEGQEAKSDGNAVLEAVLHNLASTIAEKQATITSDPIPVVCIQETHLIQVLQNLLGNALKYNGALQPQIHIGASVRPGDTLISVKDNGIGIAPQFHARAFGMFKRLHKGTVKGTGIGLAVCKRIVEHYGGRIWIESEAGQGATFFFTIPSTVVH
jgi:PAS domain S-box-containing protein